MIQGEICFKAGVLYLSDKIQEMISDGDNVRKIEEKIDQIQNGIRKSQETLIS